MAIALEDTVAAAGAAPSSTMSEIGGTVRPSGGAHLPAGKQLGHFRIERLLGAGGMGEVYLATDLALDRPVAIKVLPEAAAKSPSRRDRLVREARAQARISHPNVAHIYFIGEDDGRLYFAMEHIGGETLADMVAKGPLPVDDALDIIRAAVLGLREAGKHGVTHRDVKPSNLMLDANGVVKLLDFGLAAQRDPADTSDDTASFEQTSIAGTPLYMAPEQARGEPIDLRADIYALGATLYHLVTGRPPFEADSADALRSKHETAARPLMPRRSGHARATVTAIDALVARMMAPAPEDRFATYEALLRDLELASSDYARPAGASVRIMSTLVDFIMMLVVVGLVSLVIEVAGYEVDFDVGPVMFATFGVFAFLSIGRWGRTFGEAMFELEVVDVVTGKRPRPRATAFRLAIPLALPLGSTGLQALLSLQGLQLATIGQVALVVVQLAPLVALIWASVRVPGKRTVWDRWSGTMVRYRARQRSSYSA